MSIDFARLARQGRAKSASKAWEPEEFDVVLLLERERRIARTAAADYVRNGIMTLEAYDEAQEKDFKPKTQDEAVEEAEKSLRERGAKIVKNPEKTKEKKEND